MIVSYIDHKYNGLRTLSIKMKKKKPTDLGILRGRGQADSVKMMHCKVALQKPAI